MIALSVILLLLIFIGVGLVAGLLPSIALMAVVLLGAVLRIGMAPPPAAIDPAPVPKPEPQSIERPVPEAPFDGIGI